MSQENYLLVHDSCPSYVKKLKLWLTNAGGNASEVNAGQRNALDTGREEFYRLSKTGVSPIVIGCGDGAALAVAIAQRCPVKGLICVSPAENLKGFERHRLSISASRNLFLVVAPTVLALGSGSSHMSKRMIELLPSERLKVIQFSDDEIWTEKALIAILEQLRNIRDSKKLVLRQILSL